MGELHRALEVADLAGQHQPGTGHQILLDVFGVEEGGGDPWPTLLQRDDEVLPARRALGPADFGLLDLIDDGDVLALLGRFVILAKDGRALAVLARIVAQQAVNGADAEDLVE